MESDFSVELERVRSELKAHIKRQAIDAGEFARKAKVKANTLSSFLTGTTKVPRLDFLLALIQNTDYRPYFMKKSAPASEMDLSQGLPRPVRDAVQKAVQMIETFISVVPPSKRIVDDEESKVKKGLFVMSLADHLVAGRQEEIPALMEKVIQAFSLQSK